LVQEKKFLILSEAYDVVNFSVCNSPYRFATQIAYFTHKNVNPSHEHSGRKKKVRFFFFPLLNFLADSPKKKQAVLVF